MTGATLIPSRWRPAVTLSTVALATAVFALRTRRPATGAAPPADDVAADAHTETATEQSGEDIVELETGRPEPQPPAIRWRPVIFLSTGALAGAAYVRRRQRAQIPAVGQPLLPQEVPVPAEAKGLAAATQPLPDPDRGDEGGAQTKAADAWTCTCGQDYRISGAGRHRIYWLPDASAADAIITGRCVECGRDLP